uniref:Uncharacterized protein n=1 Tax=Pseudomonas phage RVTF4 TaxID=3236931 RepID=A0AB39CDF6_9VIRU
MRLSKSFHQSYFQAVIDSLEKLVNADTRDQEVMSKLVSDGYSIYANDREAGGFRYVRMRARLNNNGTVLECESSCPADARLPVLLKVVGQEHPAEQLAYDIYNWLCLTDGNVMYMPENGSLPAFYVERKEGASYIRRATDV